MATKNVIKKIIKDGVEYFIYSTKEQQEITVDSELSDTSENPVQNKVVKRAIDAKITNPSGGTAGQYLKKDAQGEEWADVDALPSGGTVGQVLTKTQSGADWEDAQGGLPEGGTEGQVLTKTNSGEERRTIASDHLEERALVGEKYALTDTLFKQLTPKLADSTVEAKVGDVAANTQIHIQRIASGTGSNQLKLKLKKVGTPGNLSVQVMKGVQVTVTANVEAYWYGDFNNVLASGTVSASSITTSWQEITVTLDNKVGGTEGELLDIVLSIPSVNASNYVVIACDSTQWSEAFSYVCVNGTTRTRSKLMPYCVSSGFAQAMLSKVDDTGVNINGINLFSKSHSETKSLAAKAMIWETLYTIEDGTTILNGSIYGYRNNSEGDLKFRILNGSTEVYTVDITSGGTYENTVTFSDKQVSTGYLVQVGFKSNNNKYTRSVEFRYNINLTGNGNIYKAYNYKGKPRSNTVKAIGNKESATLFGVHTDNSRITQD